MSLSSQRRYNEIDFPFEKTRAKNVLREYLFHIQCTISFNFALFENALKDKRNSLK